MMCPLEPSLSESQLWSLCWPKRLLSPWTGDRAPSSGTKGPRTCEEQAENWAEGAAWARRGLEQNKHLI